MAWYTKDLFILLVECNQLNSAIKTKQCQSEELGKGRNIFVTHGWPRADGFARSSKQEICSFL